MTSDNYAENRNKKHPTLSLDNQVLLNTIPHAEPKAKKTNKQAWKQFLSLCLGLLALPSLAFPATSPHQVQKMVVLFNR